MESVSHAFIFKVSPWLMILNEAKPPAAGSFNLWQDAGWAVSGWDIDGCRLFPPQWYAARKGIYQKWEKKTLGRVFFPCQFGFHGILRVREGAGREESVFFFFIISSSRDSRPRLAQTVPQRQVPPGFFSPSPLSGPFPLKVVTPPRTNTHFPSYFVRPFIYIFLYFLNIANCYRWSSNAGLEKQKWNVSVHIWIFSGRAKPFWFLD